MLRWSKFTGIVNVQPSEPFSSPLNYAHTIEPSCVIIGSSTRYCSSYWQRTLSLSLSLSFLSSIDIILISLREVAEYEIEKFKSKLERICKIKKLGVPRFFTWQSEREKGKAESLSPHPPLCTFQTRNPRLVSSRLVEPNPNLVSLTERANIWSAAGARTIAHNRR